LSQNQLYSNPIAANPKGSVKGLVIDKISNNPVEYANLAIFNQKDSSMVGGSITDSKGYFIIENLPFGNYYIRVSFIGYKSIFIPNITITPKAPNLNIGKIMFQPTAESLGEVNIVAEKNLMEYSLDKKVINVSQNLTSAGGSAVDVLQNVPSVSVDYDGNVSLRGSTNINILIDGRPAIVSGTNKQAILEQIPASSIDAIEIITNPSAKYNPEGMSGIINIKTKKRISTGLNGVASVSAGTGNRYNSSLNLNYSLPKINIFGSWDGRWFRGKGYGNTYRNTWLNDTITYSYQNMDMQRSMINNTFKAGFDWFINSQNTLTISGQFNPGSSSRTQDLYSYSYDYLHVITDNLYKKNVEEEDNKNYSVSLNYKKNFNKKNQEFTTDISYSKYSGNENTDMNNNQYILDYVLQNPVIPVLQKQYDIGSNYNFNAQINYSHPLNDKNKIEVGYNGIIRNMDNNYYLENYNYITAIYERDNLYDNHFNYNENIQALYTTFGSEWGKSSLQLGLRVEKVYTTSDQLTQNQKIKNDYFSLFPTLHYSLKLPKKNEVQISYSRRVNRPVFEDLNPFKDYSNPLMIRMGNPYLLPEYINSFEVNHSKFFDKTSVYTSIYYRTIDDVIKRLSYLGQDGINYNTSVNLSKGTNYGVDFIVEREILKWWRVNANFSYFRTIIKGNSVDGNISNDNYSWTSKLTSNMNLLKNMTIQLSANYRAPIITPQGKMYENYGADIAVKKDFMKDLLSVSFRVSDIFNTQKFNMDAYGTGFYSTMIRKRQTQMAFISVSYKINGGIKQKTKKRSVENGSNIEDADF
jgi:hypothetical protein